MKSSPIQRIFAKSALGPRHTGRLAALLFFLLFLPNFAGFFHPAWAEEGALRLITNGGYLVEDGSGRFRHRENELFVPASTLKILTCLVALERFGPDYRFETHLFLDGRGNLYIKGFGDPLLTSEAVLDIGKKLMTMGIGQVRSIRLDDSAFDLRDETASEENSPKSYDAPNGALAVNFNAVAIMVGEKGRISSGEPETPLLPLMRQLGQGLEPGSHRLNINTLKASPGGSAALRYAGELFIAQLQQAGIVVHHAWKIQTTPANLRPILVHRSQASLDEIVSECLKYSNNFIANQLFLACGAQSHGLPATWQKARLTFRDYAATTLGLSKDILIMMEGAGLSRDNQLSAAALIVILNRFKPYAALLQAREAVPMKSGTLTGVYCYAGYFPLGEILIPFAILLNQPENTRNQVLKELQGKVYNQLAQP